LLIIIMMKAAVSRCIGLFFIFHDFGADFLATGFWTLIGGTMASRTATTTSLSSAQQKL
jgi:hypothetical protein